MNDCSETPGDTWNSSHVKPCDIIYVKTDLMLKFFRTRHIKINVTYILLSGSRCVEQLWHLSSVQMHVQRIMSTATRCITVCAGSVDMSDLMCTTPPLEVGVHIRWASARCPSGC